MDAFEGPYVWEMTDAQFEASLATLVGVEVVSVDPAQDAGAGPVRIVAVVPFQGTLSSQTAPVRASRGLVATTNCLLWMSEHMGRAGLAV